MPNKEAEWDGRVEKLKQELWKILDAFSAKNAHEEQKFPDFPSADDFPVLHDAVACFGMNRQIGKCIEELGELTQALSKAMFAPWDEIDTAAVRGELADVQITIMQMAIVFGSYLPEAEFKYARLKRLVNEEIDRQECISRMPIRGEEDVRF